MEARIGDALALVGEVIDSVASTLFAEEATAYVLGDARVDGGDAAAALNARSAQLLRAAVAERLPRFDQLTLHTLNAALAVPSVKGDRAMQGTIAAIKAEVLRQTAATLPEEMRTLERLTAARDAAGRAEILQTLTREEVERTAFAAGQLLEDMEVATAVGDVALLARMALAHDAACAEAAARRAGGDGEAGGDSDGAEQGRRAVTVSASALVKELMPVGNAAERRAAIACALDEGCKAVLSGADVGDAAGAALEPVRPGALLSCTRLLVAEVRARPPAGAEQPQSLLARLEAIHADAVAATAQLAGLAPHEAG